MYSIISIVLGIGAVYSAMYQNTVKAQNTVTDKATYYEEKIDYFFDTVVFG